MHEPSNKEQRSNEPSEAQVEPSAFRELSSSTREQFSETRIQPDFAEAVEMMRSTLSELTAYLKAEGLHDLVQQPDGKLYQGERRFGPSDRQIAILVGHEHSKEVSSAMENFRVAWQKFDQAARELPADKQTRAEYAEYAQARLETFLDQSSFADWARHKRGGHAGDVGIVKMILGRERPVPPHLRTPTFVGYMIDEFMLDTAVATAHRNRIEIIKTWLSTALEESESRNPGQTFRVLNLGCGPAGEYEDFFLENKDNPGLENLQIVLRDFAQESLDEALHTIALGAEKAGFSPQVDADIANAVKWAIADIKARRQGTEMEQRVHPCDAVYCAGLYDYLDADNRDDPFSMALTSALYAHTKPGKLMLVTNVDPGNPDRYQQELLINWPLVERDANDMQRLGEYVGAKYRPDLDMKTFLANPASLKPGEFLIDHDATGVNIFLWIRKEL